MSNDENNEHPFAPDALTCGNCARGAPFLNKNGEIFGITCSMDGIVRAPDRACVHEIAVHEISKAIDALDVECNEQRKRERAFIDDDLDALEREQAPADPGEYFGTFPVGDELEIPGDPAPMETFLINAGMIVKRELGISDHLVETDRDRATRIVSEWVERHRRCDDWNEALEGEIQQLRRRLPVEQSDARIVREIFHLLYNRKRKTVDVADIKAIYNKYRED